MSQNAATGVSPWHMWGNKKTATLVFNSLLAPAIIATEQLANVQYKRPDTWRFLFAATLMQMAPAVAPGLDLITIDFDLTLGLGLGTQIIKSFAHFEFEPSTDVGVTLWTASAVGPKRTSTDTHENLTSEIVAETIQCNARCQLNGAQLGTALVEVSAYFAPNVHVRPDWDVHHFSGELGGR